MLNGRINRKTFIIGNLVALAILGVICFIVVVPVALLEIVIKNNIVDHIFNTLFYILAFPALLYLYYVSVLMIKRAHDIGLPGLLIALGVITCIIVAKLADLHYFNLLAILIVFGLALAPGARGRNNFGPMPRKKFRPSELKINT
jgi:uncharacterized membrane protein YhaH (DUF805 family)